MPTNPPGAAAPAKINLTLHVTGRQPDGYHQLDSLVVFAALGDWLRLHDGPGPALVLTGPRAAEVPQGDDNLVLRAARLIGAPGGVIELEKHLPAASGMGGGSSDAAAALRLLASAQGLALPDTAALMRLGADLPVCMAAPLPCRMRGLGERVTPLAGVPSLHLLIANPGLPLSTPAVFRALARPENPPMPQTLPQWPDAPALAQWLRAQRNDLEAPARALVPEIGALLGDIAAQPGCLLARMTGSGATCFGIFTGADTAANAAEALQHTGRFVAATTTAGSD